jgi:hypothetical protein
LRGEFDNWTADAGAGVRGTHSGHANMQLPGIHVAKSYLLHLSTIRYHAGTTYRVKEIVDRWVIVTTRVLLPLQVNWRDSA